MRSLILFIVILFSSAISQSCRSSRQTVVERSDSVAVAAERTADISATDEILSLINASRSLNLSGITVEFFPPDSVHPDARAAPKALRIESAESKESAGQSTKINSTFSGHGDEKLDAHAGSASHEQSESVKTSLHPPDWIVIGSFVITISIFLFIIFRYLRK